MLDHGRLAKIDLRVFAELNAAGGVQMVKVPVSEALWSTWRRYCEAMGLSMGAGVARLIVGELVTVVDGDGTTAAKLADQIAEKAQERSLRLDAWRGELEEQAESLRRKEERLRTWERTLGTSQPAAAHDRYTIKVGRNERCPCGSGVKYKHCHGGPLRLDA